jgi:hypothetical protein
VAGDGAAVVPQHARGAEVEDESGRGLTGLWSRLGARRPSGPAAEPLQEERPALQAPAHPTKALRKFLATLSTRESPVLLDLGPVVGSNLNFFGESLGCKVFIEDLYADLERHLRAGTVAEFPTFLAKRLSMADGSVDGVLAWDLLDYLDAASAQALANELVRVMRVDAALLGFFSASAPRGERSELHYTKYVVEDEATLRHREYPASRGRQRVLQNRDVIRLFDGLRVSDSFLLQSNVREILFRKPGYLSAARPAQ